MKLEVFSGFGIRESSTFPLRGSPQKTHGTNASAAWGGTV
jgi:hypothetical protein